MKKPPHSFANIMSWDDWKITFSDDSIDAVQFGYPQFITAQSKTLLDVGYPGFTAALALLEASGCDHYLVTSVLKFCIIQVNNEPLDTFLSSSPTLALVEHVLALDLTWDDNMAALAVTKVKDSTDNLPQDLAFGSCT